METEECAEGTESIVVKVRVEFVVVGSVTLAIWPMCIEVALVK